MFLFSCGCSAMGIGDQPFSSYDKCFGVINGAATVSDDRGGFWCLFGADLLLSKIRKAANPLSISGLYGSIMFNPKNLDLSPELPPNVRCFVGFSGVCWGVGRIAGG